MVPSLIIGGRPPNVNVKASVPFRTLFLLLGPAGQIQDSVFRFPSRWVAGCGPACFSKAFPFEYRNTGPPPSQNGHFRRIRDVQTAKKPGRRGHPGF